MADVKWIRLDAKIFRNRKIKQLEALPAGDSIIVIWLKLLCLANEVHDPKCIINTNRAFVPIEEYLADRFNRPLNVVRLELLKLEDLGMIKCYPYAIYIVNWDKWQKGREN